MATIDSEVLGREMRRYNTQKRIEKEITKKERQWYKQRDDIDQKDRLKEIRKIIERETNYDN